VYADGFGGAWKSAKEISIKEPAFPKLDKYGPELEQLLAEMLTYDPAKRPQSAEVALRAKQLN